MAKVIGDAVGIPNPQPDCLQTDASKADYIKNKHIFANAIKGNASGTSIAVDDVAANEHDLAVTLTYPTETGYNLAGVPVKCAATLYGEDTQTATATADGIVTGLTSIAPSMALWTEYGGIKGNDVLSTLYFDTNANIDAYLADLPYGSSGTIGVALLLRNASASTMLAALDLNVFSSGTVQGYSLAVLTLSSGTVQSVTTIYSTVAYDDIQGISVAQAGWQMSSVSFSTIVSEVASAFAPLNGTIVKTLPHVIINVEYIQDIKKYIDKLIGDIEGTGGTTGNLVVIVSGDDENGYSANVSYEDIVAAYNAGRTVVCSVDQALLPLLTPPIDGVVGFAASIGASTALCVYIAEGNSVMVESVSPSITIGEQTWSGDNVDFTDTIEAMIEEGNEGINGLLEKGEASKNILPPDSEPGHYDVTNNSAPSSNADTTSNIRIPSPIPVRSGVPIYVTTNGFNDNADISVCVSVLDSQGVQVKYQLFRASKNNFGSEALWLPTTENISILVYVQGAKKVGMTMADVCVSYEAGAEFEPYKPESGLTVRTDALSPEALKMFAPLYGKTVVNFGDSIFGKRRPPEDISTFLASLTGATVYNCGFGGCRMAQHSMSNFDAFSMYRLADAIVSGDFTYQDAGIADTTQSETVPSYFSEGLEILKSLDFKKVDTVTIAYGTNDFTAGVNMDNPDNAYDTATLAGALRHSLEALLTAYPHLKIFLCSQTYRFWMDASNVFTDDSDTHLNTDGVRLCDFVAKTEEVAKEYHLPYINNYDIGMNRFNRSQYFPVNDGTHPLASGCRLIAEHMAKELF